MGGGGWVGEANETNGVGGKLYKRSKMFNVNQIPIFLMINSLERPI